MKLHEFEKKYSTQNQCLDYLVSLRWPNGICCSRSPCQEYMQRKRKKYTLNVQYKFRCGYCRHQYSVISDTLFQGTQYKLMPLWFRAVWYITAQKGGTSALGLQKFLGLESYRTAWTWLQKLRQVMVASNQDKLNGTIVIDNFPILINKDGYYEEKYSILIAVELIENKISQIRLRCNSASPQNISNFIQEHVKSGSTILGTSDNIRSGLSEIGYTIKYVSKKRKNKYDVLPPVHSVIAYLEKNQLLGRLAALCSEDNLDLYLNECCFKFNNRDSKDTWFDNLLQLAIYSKPK